MSDAVLVYHTRGFANGHRHQPSQRSQMCKDRKFCVSHFNKGIIRVFVAMVGLWSHVTGLVDFDSEYLWYRNRWIHDVPYLEIRIVFRFPESTSVEGVLFSVESIGGNAGTKPVFFLVHRKRTDEGSCGGEGGKFSCTGRPRFFIRRFVPSSFSCVYKISDEEKY